MKLVYKILRSLAVIAFALGVGLPAIVYVALSTPWVQNRLRDIGTEELGKYLGTEVHIDRLAVRPFNRLAIDGVVIDDDYGKPALSIDNIDARFELFYFMRTGKIVIDYVSVHKPSVSLYKKDENAPLNIAKIIAKVSKKDPNKPPTKFSLAINTVEITDGACTYDILTAPRKASGFDAKHIGVKDLTAYATLPRLSNENVVVDLHHLSLLLNNKFKLSDLRACVSVADKDITLSNFDLSLPRTHIALDKLIVPKDVQKLGRDIPFDVTLGQGTTVCPADLALFVPKLESMTRIYDLHTSVQGLLSDFNIKRFELKPHTDNDLILNLQAQGGYADKQLNLKDLNLDLKASANEIARLLTIANLKSEVAQKIQSLGATSLTANLSGTFSKLQQSVDGALSLATAMGTADVDGHFDNTGSAYNIDADADVSGIDLAMLTNKAELGMLSANAQVSGSWANGTPIGSANVKVSHLDFRGITFNDLTANVTSGHDGSFTGNVTFDNQMVGSVDVRADGLFDKTLKNINLDGKISDLALWRLLNSDKYVGYRLSARTNSHIQFTDNNPYGYILCDNIRFKSDDPEQKSLFIRLLALQSKAEEDEDVITLTSDFINGSAHGRFNWHTIVPEFNQIAAQVLPDFINNKSTLRASEQATNSFAYNFTIANAESISNFVNMPVKVIYPVTIDGDFDFESRELAVNVDAPWLQQGEKIIEGTALKAKVADSKARANLCTQFPTKKGDMKLDVNLTGADNRIDTGIDWLIKREKPINGNLSFSTLLSRNIDNNLCANVHVNPGDITFGDDLWHIGNAEIRYIKNLLDVRNFTMSTPTQSLSINGLCTDAPDTRLDVDIENLNLISIFETLDINNALIGGRATGRISASNIFDKIPHVWSDGLRVKNISYNYCVLGDALVKTHFDSQKNSFYIDADLTGNHGDKSRIYGDIYTVGESLDFNFDANHVEIGFMKPFMQAFAADLSGTASGHARLYGTFKDIDLEGDLYAENLGIKLDFTNTWYYASDSVHIRPGRILLKDITIKDVYGNTALLNGYVNHTYFHSPVFEFKITEAEKLLCYDVTSKTSPDWYGRIFGTGSAAVTGKPGVVDISVDMFTNANSVFTFVLSDMEEANDYTFITFRDATPVAVQDSVVIESKIPKEVLEYRDRVRAANQQNDVPTAYNMDIKIEITPSAKLIVVMDPIGGDAIKANGTGNFRMTYASVGNDLRMYGTYTIERGSYNFTLQDIIVKDFTIREGSSITFTGDPYAARLDIDATYTVNANLSDLDESFLQDKDLNRTNVPVYAVLKASGDMRQPEIAFDLEFPTLSSDIYRKVRSIVSTDDMMNRQILYLLALNRFYTPEYMQTTKGNELFSVASSTISSQLSSILGKFSDNWSIAPNLRSDRGDFTDLEVDVALSSSLLNNRLRLNGNFGYRDKSLNTNQFIGDFDLEYILNRRGSWRLKAYNRYNDQNYYLRTATTTQGVGIVFKRDFDSMLDFRRKKNRILNDSIKSPTLKLPTQELN